MMEKQLGHHLKTHTDRHEEKKHTANEYWPMLILIAIVYNILIWLSLKLLLLPKILSTWWAYYLKKEKRKQKLYHCHQAKLLNNV